MENKANLKNYIDAFEIGVPAEEFFLLSQSSYKRDSAF
jgi:hypothetical protein